MFSHLCRVTPRALWDRKKAAAAPGAVVEEKEEEGARCQLEHCTFCDRKDEGAPFLKDFQHLQSSPGSCFEVTENPAYGLSTKHWLEHRDEEDDSQEYHFHVLNEAMEHYLSVDTRPQQNPNSGLVNTNPQKNAGPPNTNPLLKHPSQQEPDCDADMNTFGQSSRTDMTETRFKRIDAPNERSKAIEPKHGLTWSVLKHRQLDSFENCDNKTSVIDNAPSDKPSCDSNGSQEHTKRIACAARERSFPLSLMKPIAKMVEKRSPDHQTTVSSRTRQEQKTHPQRRFSHEINPLSAIEQIKTEESIQEWLARIGESTGGEENRSSCPDTAKSKLRTEATHVLHQGLQEALEMSHKPLPMHPEETEHVEGACPLSSASRSVPAAVPMVVMQCSRLHSHIGSRPPFQQASLPMGTLVTALYREADWLYVQTPHGVEGFIVAAHCTPIGGGATGKKGKERPWEPGDSPEGGTGGGGSGFVRVPGCVSAVQMKTDFYSDRYFTHTFKSRDSIKTAKTVTDILRNSPETKVSSNQ